MFFVEITAQPKAWSANIVRHVSRRPELLEWGGGAEKWLWGGEQGTGYREL